MVAISKYIDHTIHLTEAIPAALKILPQWVCWRSEEHNGRSTKISYDPKAPFSKARSNAPQTWGTFEQALEIYRQDGRFDGIGFTFSADDPYAGIDLDDCLDSLTGGWIWGQEIVDYFNSYTEVSPSGCGVKIFIRGTKTAGARSHVKKLYADREIQMEIYDQRRFFTVTGHRIEGGSTVIRDCQAELTELCEFCWPSKQPGAIEQQIEESGMPEKAADLPTDNRFIRCLAAMLNIMATDRNDGSNRLFAAACRCVEHDLTDRQALACLEAYAVQRPFPAAYSPAEYLKRLRDAERTTERGKALAETVDREQLLHTLVQPENRCLPRFQSVAQLIAAYPALRTPIIHNLLREGETMNMIAAPKTGKSWLVTDLAMCAATGRQWLNQYDTVKGKVLVLDNELHGETIANRLPQVAAARGIDLSELAETLFIENMRGRLVDIFALEDYFYLIEPEQFKIIILDAFYRFMPSETDENDNGTMAQVYNHIDRYADRLKCAFILIHHTSKGNQSIKSITDVGAGAGAQSRATDTHLILRPHQKDKAIVLDAAVRSWPPLASMCLRWEFPVWQPAPDLDPKELAMISKRSKNTEAPTVKVVEPDWTPESFVGQFLSEEPKTKDEILIEAKAAGLSQANASKLLGAAESKHRVCRWKFAANQKVQFSTIPQPLNENNDDPKKE